jgi:hypothetical protein
MTGERQRIYNYQSLMNYETCTSLYKSVANESKFAFDKQIQNASQQCSSDIQSISQIMREQIKHNLFDINKSVLSRSTDALDCRTLNIYEKTSIKRCQSIMKYRWVSMKTIKNS